MKKNRVHLKLYGTCLPPSKSRQKLIPNCGKSPVSIKKDDGKRTTASFS